MPIEENNKTYPFAKILSMNDISKINRALGMIEGLAYSVQDPGLADGFVSAIEQIEAVIDKEGENGK